MPTPSKETRGGNRLLSALPDEEYRHLLPHLELIHLEKGEIIYMARDSIKYVYFPLTGMFSLLSTTESGSTVEVAMVGSEGIVGLPVVLSMDKVPYEVMIQLTSDTLRIEAEILRKEFDRGGRLHELMLRYTHVLITQISQSAVCNRFHTVEKRLCRWLLIARDRVNSNTIDLTQEIIAHMLGIPRTGVTMAAGALQRAGLIRYSRGKIEILDYQRLRDASCECYEIIKEEFDRFLSE
ncbi:MAG: Crp/Fnr family transcriptional regulator [Acidobacteria bacterium]|nr:MAG: Crp/Fnr family transcriptional regulator [Acidobacteriota bacterium]